MGSTTFSAENSNAKQSLRKKMDQARSYAGDKWTPLLFLAAAVTTVGFALPVGWALGGLNTPVKILQDWCNKTLIATHHVVLSKTEFDFLWSLIISVFLIGGVVGGLTGAWFADRMGRKGTLVLGNILNVISAAMFFSSKYIPSVDIFFVGRILVGFNGGLMTTVVPMYLNELSPQKLAGSMGTLFCSGLCFGILVSQIMGLNYLLGTPTLWPYLVSGFVVCSIFVFIALPFLPESPKYLHGVRRQHEKALEELAKLRNLPKDVVAWELRSDEATQGRTREKWSLVRVLSTPRLRLPLLLVLSLQAGQQFAGINAVFYYSSQIFEAAGLSDTAIQYANLSAGAINSFMTAVSMWLVHSFRRRTLIITSCASAIVNLVMLTVFSKLLNYASWIPAASVCTVMLYVFCFDLGLAPIPFFIGAELVDIGPRPTIMALGSVANWGANFLVGSSFPSLYHMMGENAFLIFVGFTTLLLIFISMYLPETSRPHEHALPSEEDPRDDEDLRTDGETDRE